MNWGHWPHAMKGIVFREFLEMVEATFGEEMLEALIAENDLPSGGAYTAVGTYDHQELVAMAITLSKKTDLPVEALVEAFGNYLFGRFLELFPVFFNHPSSFEFLDTIHDVVHVEVLKLYPDATLPDFTSEIKDDGRTLHFEYNSPRHFADLAVGLMKGAFAHWGETVDMEREDTVIDGHQVTMFTCRLIE